MSHQRMSNIQGTGNGYAAHGNITANTAAEEKRDMQGLNERLAAHLNRLRQLQAQAGQMDTSAYHAAIRSLEDEVAKVKDTYQGELDRLRRALDECNRDKNNMAVNAEKNAILIHELKNKANQLEALNNKLLSDVNNLQGNITGKDKLIADLQACLEAKERELEKMRPLAKGCARDLDDLKKRLEEEFAGRRDAEDKLRQLCAQREFDKRAYEDQIRDLKQRLDTSGGIITSLEAKIRELTNVPGMNLQALLQQLRDGTAAELRRLQKETDEELSRQLSCLRGQLDEHSRDKEQLQSAKQQLQAEVDRLKVIAAELQAQLGGCCQKNKELGDALNSERADSKRCIDELERRLHDLQENLMHKVKECNHARDNQMALKAEIDAYKSLLDAEERRLTKPSGGVPTTNMAAPSCNMAAPSNGASGSGVGPGLTAKNSSPKYTTARDQPTAGTGTKNEYCALHGHSTGRKAGTGAIPHGRGITEYTDRYCDMRSRMLHANVCGAPGFNSKARNGYTVGHK